MEQLSNFKNLFFIGMVFWVLGLNAQTDSTYTELPKSGMELQDLIPHGWQILSQASGDLNQDGYADLAFAIQSPLEETIAVNDGSERDTLQTNPRILGIYFGKRNGRFKKALQSNTFIINRNTPAMDEPFKGLQILPDGILQIDFYIWPCRECTSWSSHEYQFSYQNKTFELVNYSESETQRVSGEDTEYHIDFQSRIMKITTTLTNDEEEREFIEESKKFELRPLQSIESLGKPFEWEFFQLRI